ncbi:MAG: hypothetical protein ABW067_15640 [Rhizobacter sp.]
MISINDSAFGGVVIRMSHTDLALLDDLLELAEEQVSDRGTAFNSEDTREELHRAQAEIRFAIKTLREV